MHRFKYLTDKINNGVPVNESKRSANTINRGNPELIHEWSPNNVRRLVIGFEHAFVHHYVTSRKTSILIEHIDLRREAVKDLEGLNSGGDYKSIILTLTSGRVLSSVEELIFLTKGYPEAVLRQDTDLTLLEGDSRIESRFPRLRHISLIDTDYSTLGTLMERTKGKTVLLLDALREESIPTKILIEPHPTDWWSGSALRPHRYSMDGGVLAKYFEGVKEGFSERLKEEQKLESRERRDLGIYEKNIPELLDVLQCFKTLVDRSTGVFTASSLVSKSEWSNVLQDKSQYRALRSRILETKVRSTSVRRIDFETITATAGKVNTEQGKILRQHIIEFHHMLYASILTGVEEYKRDSNKDDLVTSITSLKKLGVILLRTEVNIVYLALIRYLTRNTPKYAEFFYGLIREHLPSVVYTRSVVEFCNKYAEEGLAKKAFDSIGAEEVLEDQFKLGARYEEALKILDALDTVSKS